MYHIVFLLSNLRIHFSSLASDVRRRRRRKIQVKNQLVNVNILLITPQQFFSYNGYQWRGSIPFFSIEQHIVTYFSLFSFLFE
jgi:hypothetical protein